MNIKASRGCFLTQSKDIPLKDRIFEEQITLSYPEEVLEWKEVNAQERKQLEDEGIFFEVKDVDINYLHKVDQVVNQVAQKVNDAPLTNDEALEMQKYYPQWENLQGKEVGKGYKLQYEGLLLEVVEPHMVSEETRPQLDMPVAMSLIEEETTTTPHTYYKQVEPTIHEKQ